MWCHLVAEGHSVLTGSGDTDLFYGCSVTSIITSLNLIFDLYLHSLVFVTLNHICTFYFIFIFLLFNTHFLFWFLHCFITFFGVAAFFPLFSFGCYIQLMGGISLITFHSVDLLQPPELLKSHKPPSGLVGFAGPRIDCLDTSTEAGHSSSPLCDTSVYVTFPLHCNENKGVSVFVMVTHFSLYAWICLQQQCLF